MNTQLPALWRLRGKKCLAPVDIRAALAETIHQHGGVATIMEAHDKTEGETNTALFNRIVKDFGIDRFFVYWPSGAQRTGLDVELGFLLQMFHDGKEPDVRIFVESTAGGMDGGHFTAHEKGRRTTYYEDLVAYGCPLIEWESYERLRDAVAYHGL